MKSDAPQSREVTLSATGFLDLPADVLHEIFSYFGEPYVPVSERWLPHREVTWELRKTLSSVRLTCRAFTNIAAPFMLTIVDVVPDQASLDRIAAISRHPMLRRHVHGVCLGLSYYTRELSANFSTFSLGRIGDLIRLDTSGEPYATSTCRSIREAWDEEVWSRSSLPGKDKGTQMSAEYRRLLREGFAKYQRGREGTRSLVQSGSFVRQLAASISRLPRFDALHFRLAIGRDEMWYGHQAHTMSLDGIAALLSSPFTEARYVYRGGTTTELVPATIVLDLPRAIHGAGATLRHLTMDHLPFISDGMIGRLSKGLNFISSMREGFKAAFENVESIYIHQFRPPFHEYPIWARIMRKYVRAIVSGPLVKSVSLGGDSCYSRNSVENDRDFPFGPALSSITWPGPDIFGRGFATAEQRDMDAASVTSD